MLLFKIVHIKPILLGIKTQTRRNWKKQRVNIGTIHLAKTKMLSKEYFCKLKILKVYQQYLYNMSKEDCEAELCNSLDEYLDLFWDINKKGLTKLGFKRETIHEIKVWVVEFKVFTENQYTLETFIE